MDAHSTARPHSPEVTPRPGELPNVKRDAARAFAVLQAGGVVIAPTDIRYDMMSASVDGIERAYAAKERKTGHTLGIIGTYALHEKLHDVLPQKLAVTRTFTEELGLTIGVIAKMKRSAGQLIPNLERVTKNGTLHRTLRRAIPTRARAAE